MKRIFTLSLVMLLSCVCVMAQVVLGDIKFSLGEGKKISPTTGKILVTFPDVTGVDESAAFVVEGSFGLEGTEFDGVEGTFASGVTFDLAEYELQPSTNYALTITSVKVEGAEYAPEGGYVLNFITRGAERKLSWTFQIDEDTKAKIIADDGNDPAYNESAGGTYWKCIAADTRHYIHQNLKNDEIMLDANNVFPMSEDLVFQAGTDKMFVGDLTGSFAGMLVFNGNNLYMTVPDCRVGDIIAFSGVNATKGSASKQTCIQAMSGAALAIDGIESSTGLVDSIWVSAKGTYKFESQVDGDITFLFGQFRMTNIDITEGQPKVARNYNIVGGYVDGDNTVVLKELVAKKQGTTGDVVKTNYPYWLADAEGNAYTYGTKGTEFKISFELKNNGAENEDTTFVIDYKKTDYTGVVYLTEGEDLEGAVICTNGNSAIRSSMGKAGYFAEDLKLVTLQPGTYKIRAILFDAGKTPSYQCVLTKGEGEENEIYLTATATNWTETESDLLTITEPTDITLKAGGGEDKGLDAIMIYASTDAPDDPDGIVSVKSADEKAAVRKIAKDGYILIQTPAGTFNAVGAQVK